MTDFGFHSIEIVLTKLNRMKALLRFVQDTFVEGGMRILSISSQRIRNL